MSVTFVWEKGWKEVIPVEQIQDTMSVASVWR